MILFLQANTKVKLLVRSHAMRESTSPPREPHNNGSSSPHSPQSVDGEKKISPNKLSPNSSANGKQLNNNDSMLNSNLTTSQSPPKQMRNTATSPTCRIPSKNGTNQSSLKASVQPRETSYFNNAFRFRSIKSITKLLEEFTVG